MRRELVPLVSLFIVTALMWSAVVMPVSAQHPGWSGDGNLAFLLEINGISAANSNSTAPIPVSLSDDLNMSLTIETGADIILKSGVFVMQYLSIPIINQPFDFNVPVPSGTTQSLMNTSIPLGSLLGSGGIDLISGTVSGYFSFIYSLTTSPDDNVTVTEDFFLHIGPQGPAAIMSVTGAITVGFTLMSVFGLLLALDDFQQGILAARKMRRATRASDIGIFPRSVVLRRRPKKKGAREDISQEELVRRVAEAARTSWDGRHCPKCGKRWKKSADRCKKCNITRAEAMEYFAHDIAKYAPRALKIVRPKSKVTVGSFSKKLKLTPDRGGALAAALTDMGVFQTRSVKVPLRKVALSGMTLAGTYWSWMQLVGGATPSWIDILLTTTVGLVVSVIIAYCMNWLARVPRLGYE
ncbi:MAG: hypothetical protein DRO93_01485 [Candidatus Thorarchaeota archaeon]|nr:MAG: hypothetical protein DRO93_01485 [Candidatus Thorarchaeota archaeon]